jgi:hypothetical protein
VLPVTAGFLKAAWTIVAPDVVRVFEALWVLDFRSFYHINEATMVLLQKSDAPVGLRDYRPISLIHSIGKLFAKGLAMRLAPRMSELVKTNQSAFIRGRRIHENFRAVQLTCKYLQARHIPTVLDLAKAFDTVAWPFLLEVLEHAGFPARWREWISAMLRTASTKVLINGRPGQRLCHARGLRQGDPLSPFLFILVMEVLNSLISEADRRGQLTPLPGHIIKHRASIYADDLVIFLAPNTVDFSCVAQLLELFAGASGLATNVDKCAISPIRCSQEEIDAVLEVFPCKLQAFPSMYLGAPLHLSRLPRNCEQAIVDNVAARLPTWKAGLLTPTGRATLTHTTLSAIPVHVSICCALSAWAIQAIDKRRRGFLWTGADSAVGGKCKVAWQVVCSPRDLGGLGLPDLRVLGFALRLRWEWLRRTEPDSPWASLPVRDERIVQLMFPTHRCSSS